MAERNSRQRQRRWSRRQQAKAQKNRGAGRGAIETRASFLRGYAEMMTRERKRVASEAPMPESVRRQRVEERRISAEKTIQDAREKRETRRARERLAAEESAWRAREDERLMELETRRVAKELGVSLGEGSSSGRRGWSDLVLEERAEQARAREEREEAGKKRRRITLQLARDRAARLETERLERLSAADRRARVGLGWTWDATPEKVARLDNLCRVLRWRDPMARDESRHHLS